MSETAVSLWLHKCHNFVTRHITILFLALSIGLWIRGLVEFGEEIPMKYQADAQQQVGVDAAFLEDAVHGLAVATQFGCKPSH